MGNIIRLSFNETYVKVLMIQKWSFATIQNSAEHEIGA